MDKRKRDRIYDAKRRNSPHRKLYKPPAWQAAREAQLAREPAGNQDRIISAPPLSPEQDSTLKVQPSKPLGGINPGRL